MRSAVIAVQALVVLAGGVGSPRLPTLKGGRQARGCAVGGNVGLASQQGSSVRISQIVATGLSLRTAVTVIEPLAASDWRVCRHCRGGVARDPVRGFREQVFGRPWAFQKLQVSAQLEPFGPLRCAET